MFMHIFLKMFSLSTQPGGSCARAQGGQHVRLAIQRWVGSEELCSGRHTTTQVG